MELRQLTELARQGDEAAFSELCRRFTGLVKKYAYQPHLQPLREEAEGEAWLAVAAAVRTYRAETGVPVEAYIESRIKYSLWNWFKKERRRRAKEISADVAISEDGQTLLELMASGDSVELQAERRELRIAVVKALALLPPRQSQAVRLTLLNGQKLADVARIMDISSQAVHSLCRRSIDRLACLLGDR